MELWHILVFKYHCQLPTQFKKRLVIGAHYDVYDNQPGADDNTSGVAGMLSIAEALAKNQITIPRFGSENGAESLNVAVAAAIVLGQAYRP